MNVGIVLIQNELLSGNAGEETKLPARVVTKFFFCSANDAEKLVLMKARSKLGSATLVGTLQDRASMKQNVQGKSAVESVLSASRQGPC